ncbi:glycosyltransferase [Paenibacillus piri]|uniref:Glycosyltransferase n=1 Tax=Paenibacillus piri TaxID=2547395 RepID=A0A4R5KL82_9BACL|nr:glycosyltransferase family 2 protein [Paenibacillus piri]TDF96333.1 glycosyltransferase [Paenibacillus piri]
MILEENFLSVIMVARNCADVIEDKVNRLDCYLKSRFKHYEIIVVENFSRDNTLQLLKNCAAKLTILELARFHNVQQALRAGVDISIGDYILEIDEVRLDYDMDIIFTMYEACLKGNDFVICSPQKVSASSYLFYWIINKYFKGKLNTRIASSVLVLSSRRCQNKIVETGNVIINRNISYLLSGLQFEIIYLNIKYKNNRNLFENVNLMVDTLTYYTDILTRLALFVSFLFFFISLGALLFSLVSYFIKGAVEGWTSLIMFLGFSFSGVFLMFAILTKYLNSILQSTVNTKSYIFKSVMKK